MPIAPANSTEAENPAKGSIHGARKIRAFFASIADRYDFANRVISMGFDQGWRRIAARRVAAHGARTVLDLACGSGDLTLALRREIPGAFVIGSDFCEPMLHRGIAKGLRHSILGDALRLPFRDGSFDAVTVAFGLRNMESWVEALAEMRRVLRPGGLVLVLDFSLPPAPLLWLYRPYLHSFLPRVAALLTGKGSAYEYLADSIEKFPGGARLGPVCVEAGLEKPEHRALMGGIVGMVTAVRPSSPI